ncbi:MAG: type II toxin-antitoxin system HicA family toxin [Bacteroidota bacterium]|nr:type II toxin-antitoxin system HicA family toxin [Bacteroidota bacterium]
MLSGKQLIKVLSKYGYEVVRQTGSHIRLTISTENGIHNTTIPNHESLRLGTLMSIINEISDYLGIDKQEIINKL